MIPGMIRKEQISRVSAELFPALERRQLMGRIICAAVFLLALTFFAYANDPVPVVTTTDGQTFKNVKVFKVLGDDVLLLCSDGSVKVPLASLSDETRKALGLLTRAEEAALQAKGFVKYGADWVTPQEKQRREDEKMRREEEKKRREADAKVDAEVQKAVDNGTVKGVTYTIAQATKEGSLCYCGDMQFFLYGKTNQNAVDDQIYTSNLYLVGRTPILLSWERPELSAALLTTGIWQSRW